MGHQICLLKSLVQTTWDATWTEPAHMNSLTNSQVSETWSCSYLFLRSAEWPLISGFIILSLCLLHALLLCSIHLPVLPEGIIPVTVFFWKIPSISLLWRTNSLPKDHTNHRRLAQWESFDLPQTELSNIPTNKFLARQAG